MQEAFKVYIGDNKPCYIHAPPFTTEDTLKVIHEAQGLAVIAHPHLIKNNRIFQSLLQLDFDGIEGYYCRFPKREDGRWVRIGEERGWIVTGGSDFHGSIKPGLRLGCSWVGEDVYKNLQQHYLKQKELCERQYGL